MQGVPTSKGRKGEPQRNPRAGASWLGEGGIRTFQNGRISLSREVTPKGASQS